VIGDEDPEPYTATTVPFFSDDRPVIPLPVNAVELVTVTVAAVPVLVVTVKLDDPTVATVPLSCGGVKLEGRVPSAGVDELGVVDPAEVAAGGVFDERLAVTSPATTPTTTMRTATTSQVVRRLRRSSGAAWFELSDNFHSSTPGFGRAYSQPFLRGPEE
jgi:hypothetical protein